MSGINYAGLISFSGSNPTSPPVVTTSGPYNNPGIEGMAAQPNTNYIWISQNGNGLQRIYQIDASIPAVVTGTMVCSVSGGLGIYAMDTNGTSLGIAFPVLNGLASALVFNLNGSTHQMIEISTGWQQKYSADGSDALSRSSTQQAAASLVTTGTVYSTTNAVGVLNKWTTSAFGTVTPTTMDWLAYDAATCIIPISNGNFLVGTGYGAVHEMDVNGNHIGNWTALLENTDESTIASEDHAPGIVCMTFYDNVLYATDSHGCGWKVHWPTKTTITHDYLTNSDNGGGGQGRMVGGSAASVTTPMTSMMIDGASGFVLGANYWNTGSVNVVLWASDYMQSPGNLDSFAVLNGYGSTPLTWAVYSAQCQRLVYWHAAAEFLFFFNFVPNVGTRTEVSSSLFDNGAYQNGRVIRIIDQGVGTAMVTLDMAASGSTNQFSTTAGQTVLEFAVYGEGVNEKGSLSTYST